MPIMEPLSVVASITDLTVSLSRVLVKLTEFDLKVVQKVNKAGGISHIVFRVIAALQTLSTYLSQEETIAPDRAALIELAPLITVLSDAILTTESVSRMIADLQQDISTQSPPKDESDWNSLRSRLEAQLNGVNLMLTIIQTYGLRDIVCTPPPLTVVPEKTMSKPTRLKRL